MSSKQKARFISLMAITMVVLSVIVVSQVVNKDLSAQVENNTLATAQGNSCGAEQAAGSITLKIDTFKPTRRTPDDGRRFQLRSSKGDPNNVFNGNDADVLSGFEKEFLLEKFLDKGECQKTCALLLNGKEVGTINGPTDFTNEPRGGILITQVREKDPGQDFSSAEAQYVLFKKETKTIVLPTPSLGDDDGAFDLGKLSDLLGADLASKTDPPTLQEITITVSGDVKAGLGDVDNKTLTVNETELNQNLFVCKDSLGNNGICDFQECQIPVQCSDNLDNDNDGLVDFPEDPGCSSKTDKSEGNDPLCADQKDNDGDGLIDFPSDPGCSSSSDTDETDPPTPRNVTLFGQGSTTTTEQDNLYPLGIQANFPNNIYVRARVGSRFEMVQMTAVQLPSFLGTPPNNASLHFYLLRGKDSTGKEHLAMVQGRHWDPTTFADANRTTEPWYSYFAAGGDLDKCVQEMNQRFSAVPFYLDNPFFVQQMLEMLTLCQRGPSGATPNTP